MYLEILFITWSIICHISGFVILQICFKSSINETFSEEQLSDYADLFEFIHLLYGKFFDHGPPIFSVSIDSILYIKRCIYRKFDKIL